MTIAVVGKYPGLTDASKSLIEALDVGSIYDVPRAYHAAGLDHEVLSAFGIEPAPRPNMRRWEQVSRA